MKKKRGRPAGSGKVKRKYTRRVKEAPVNTGVAAIITEIEGIKQDHTDALQLVRLELIAARAEIFNKNMKEKLEKNRRIVDNLIGD